MAMGNSQHGFQHPRLKYTNSCNEASVPPQNFEDFERRWKTFIQSLDVTPQNILNIDQLETSQKMELLLNFESKNPKCSAFHYVTLIKGLRSFKITNSKKKDEFQNAKQILTATEISLRTNNVEWVYDFLKHRGLEILVDYLSQMLLHLIKTEDLHIYPASFSGTITLAQNYQSSGMSILENGGNFDYLPPGQPSLSRIFDVSNRASARISSSKPRGSGLTRSNSSVTKLGKSHSHIVESIKECIHICLKCFRTILNNQKGCRLAFEYKDTINVITMCLVHPNYQTKSLVLDLLSAVCLIEGGHQRVIHSFDLFKSITEEERRFQTLMFLYRHHETLPLDEYNIDYAVSNMQFINIIVHSVENINLRVFLQYEFTLLGLDDFLKKLQERPGDRLNRQVDAYLDNLVDCSVLLDDAEAKETFAGECERLEKELGALQETVSVCEAEKCRKLKDGEDRIRKAEKELEKSKSREDELSTLVESLRSKIRDINVNLSDRESDMRKEIESLQDQLRKMVPMSLASEKAPLPMKPSPPIRGSPQEVKASSIEILKQKEIVVEMGDSNGNSCRTYDEESRIGTSHILYNPPVASKSRSTDSPFKLQPSIVKPHSKAERLAAEVLDTVLGNNKNVSKELKRTEMETSATSVIGDAPLMKWNILRNQQGTVFEQIDGSHVETQLDLEGFEKIFKLPTTDNEYDMPALDTVDGSKAPDRPKFIDQTLDVNVTDIENGQSDKISLLDPTRLKCLKTVVAFLKQERLLLNSDISFREWGRPLACSITTFDMSSEAADRLLYQLPSFQESDMYRDITGDSLNVLADEDRLVALLSCIDRVEMKLESILYMHSFDETYFGLQEKVRIVALACSSVMESQKLKKILEIVLAFGNRMNDSRRGKAMGFRIQSLDMLPKCRSPDDKWSLMNYIAYQIEDKFSDLMDFTSEMAHVDDASHVSMCNLLAATEELSTGLDRVSNELDVIKVALENRADLIPTKLVNFVTENMQRVNIIRKQVENAKIAFIKTVEWFGEKDLQTASPDIFFGALTRFMDCFKKAVSENSHRKVITDTNHNKTKERKCIEGKGGDGTRKHGYRTRQINADGIMDEILAGLDYQPLQAGLHYRRGKRDTPDTSLHRD